MKKKDIKRKLFAKVKKNNGWVGIVFFLFVSFFAIVLWVGLVAAFVYYISESKIMGEYKVISYLADSYEQKGKLEEGEMIITDRPYRDYVVTDRDGNVLASHGEDTRSSESAVINFQGKDQIRVTLDQATSFFGSDEEGELEVDVSMLYRWLLSKDKEGLVEEEVNGSRNLLLPVWIQIPICDNTEYFNGKSYVEVRLNDAFMMLLFSGVLLLLTLIVLIMLFVNVITSIVTQRRMTNIFFNDVVTQRHNWMWFIFKGEQILFRRKYAKHKFAILDLVFVKYRNYCVCHSVAKGEEMLRKVNALVDSQLNKGEICAHYASANFALLMSYTSEEQLRTRLEGLVKKLEGMDADHHFAFHVGVDCIGSAAETGRTWRKLVDIEKEYNDACAARATLADSDDSGIAFFDTKLVEEQKWIDTVNEEQQKALDHEEFVVFYQPKYDPRTNELKGAEALIRWDSPKHGFRGPGTIIPIFEKNGFIVEIDHYMISHVARDQKRWLDEGYQCVPVSVNVSRAHFIENDLAEQIRDMVDAEGTPHDLIEIELTESAFFDDKKALITTITRLRNYGFHVSMDDFGSGYSSLNSLKDMPLDVLKLDAEFFRGDADIKRGEIVVSEAIRLAKSLNMQTVAEGVEIKEQVDFLARTGCDMIQGFYYAKPMPGPEYAVKMFNPNIKTTEGEKPADKTLESAADKTVEPAAEQTAGQPE